MRKHVRKLTKTGTYSYYVVIPKMLVDSLNWRERQKLTVQKYGKGLLIKDWKPKNH